MSHRPTRINDHTDVIHAMHPVIEWMGPDSLDLTPFCPRRTKHRRAKRW